MVELPAKGAEQSQEGAELRIAKSRRAEGAQTAASAAPAPAVEINYYTDPLCSWSWAFEAPWRRLRYEFGSAIRVRLRMGGMIPDWQTYSDPVNSVSRPCQLGPVWVHVRHITGMPLDDLLWMEDPPDSSWPACIAFKAAELQSAAAGELYLRRLREAAMVERRNIARPEVLHAVADELAQARLALLDADRFRRDMAASGPADAIRHDLKETRYLEIGRFPTLIVRGPASRSILLVGYRPYPLLLSALRHVAPDLQPERVLPATPGEYAASWDRITPREVESAFEPGGGAAA